MSHCQPSQGVRHTYNRLIEARGWVVMSYLDLFSVMGPYWHEGVQTCGHFSKRVHEHEV